MNCGGKRIILPARASLIQADADFHSGDMVSTWSAVASKWRRRSVTGTKYTYICVVKRLGTFMGVIQCVNGIRESVSRTAVGDCWASHSDSLSLPP